MMKVKPAFERLALLTGTEALDALGSTRVLVIGIGGVGSWCAEALVRSGIGCVSLVDCDTVAASNINRQVEATTATLGQLKTAVLAQRLREISPECTVLEYPIVFSRENAHLEVQDNADNYDSFGIRGADYLIDAIDSLENKLDLIEIAGEQGKTLYSSMGMAQKLDPTRIRTGDIWETEGCPLARSVRQGLRKRGYQGHFTAVYSDEPPLPRQSFPPGEGDAPEEKAGLNRKALINGSLVTVTATAGMVLASLVIGDVLKGFPPLKDADGI